MQQLPDLQTIVYKIDTIEKDIQHLQTQLQTFVPANINELQLQGIRSIVERIEGDVKDTKKSITEQKEKQDNLIIKVLWGTMTIVIGGVVSAIVFFITHPGG